MKLAANYDIVIAGGGMVGVSLALLLSGKLSLHSDQRLSILVVESFAAPANSDQSASYSPSFDARSTALSYSSRLILGPLGIWPQLQEQLTEINNIHVSERGSLGSVNMDRSLVEWPSLGYVVENAWLGNVLLAELRQHANIDFCSPASVQAITPQPLGVNCEVLLKPQHSTEQAPSVNKQSQHVHTQLVIVADGAQSQLRQGLGITVSEYDYCQQAVIANVSFQQAHQQCAYERFTEQGPMALLPLTDSQQGEPRAALVWSLPTERAEQLLHCEQAEFLAQLQQQFGHRLGAFTRLGARASYPLKLLQANEQVRSGIVLMGNAAHSLHPVAGQGFNLALRDCARLCSLLTVAHQRGEPLGAITLLQSYTQQQQSDQRKTITLSDRLPALFTSRQWPLGLLRGLGLSALDALPAAKAQFIAHAAGMQDGAALTAPDTIGKAS